MTIYILIAYFTMIDSSSLYVMQYAQIPSYIIMIKSSLIEEYLDFLIFIKKLLGRDEIFNHEINFKKSRIIYTIFTKDK